MVYNKHMTDLHGSLRKAIGQSGLSRYSIAQETGISQAQLSRYVRRMQGISIENAELIADHLGLEIVLRPKRRARKDT